MALARKSGASAISITDHDTIDGVKELLNLPHNGGPEWIPGVEISCEPPPEFRDFGSIHLLGYGFSVYDRPLNAALDKAKGARSRRNPKIIEKLNQLGIDITLEQVASRFGAEQTGRPHIAEFLKEKGVVATFDDAFDRYLGKGKPAYVEKFKISCEDAIQMLHQAGGICVLAHPGLLPGEDPVRVDAFIDTLVSQNLDGIEVYYTDHDDAATRRFADLADDLGLLVTGGSDFHGTFNQGVALGRGKDNLNISYGIFKTLKMRLEEIQIDDSHLRILEDNLGYVFNHRDLLVNALCHSSYLNENQDRCQADNERLEFLGDAVLGLCVAHLLMEGNPGESEGALSKQRSSLVSEPALAETARQVDLGRFIRLGRGEAQSKGFDKNSILSDAFEATIAAVYLDGGFDTVYRLVRDLFDESIHGCLSVDDCTDYKSALQEYAQEKGCVTPQYELAKEIGPDHDKTFEVRVELFGAQSKGVGKTKKAAEQDSARKILKTIRQPKS